MTRGRELGTPAFQIEPGDQATGEQPGIQVEQEPVGAGEDVARRCADGGVGMDTGADLAHEGGRGGVVPLDVADRGNGGRPVDADEVVEVSADVQPWPAGR